MAHTFRDRRRIEFYETDMAGIVHFSNFFRFMEATEHAFFRSLGLALHRDDGAHMSGWARVDARCTYRLPLRYMVSGGGRMKASPMPDEVARSIEVAAAP